MAVLVAALVVWPTLTRAEVARPVGPGDWWTRGRDEYRQHRTDESLGPLGAFEAWSVDLGLSASQPLYVGGKIYHLAGNSLWEVDPSQFVGGKPATRELVRNVNGEEANWRPSSSSLTFAQLPDGRKLLYYGTGDNRVCATHLSTAATSCVQLGGQEPIVGSPLVLATTVPGLGVVDLVVLGDKAGGLWVIQGLASNRWTAYRYPVSSAWITASATSVGPLDFIWAADGLGSSAGNGKLGRMTIIPSADLKHPPQLKEVWQKIMPNGIADGFAVEGRYAYFADTRGNLYRVSIDDGSYNQIPPPGPRFANSMAAIGPKHVFFSIRNVGSQRSSRTLPGELVAVDKATWQVAWRAPLPAPANTDPLVWPDQGVVMVGDTKGVIHSFDMETGQPREFARQPGQMINGKYVCLPIVQQSLLRPGEKPYEAPHAYQQLNGAGTDLTLASGSTGKPLLLAGVNATRPDGSHTGRLVAYEAGRIYNIRWTTPPELVAPKGELKPGQPVELAGLLTVDGEARWTTVRWYYVRSDGRARRLGEPQQVDLAPGRETEVRVTYTPEEGDGTGIVVGVANIEDIWWLTTPQGAWARELLAQEMEAASRPDVAYLLRNFFVAQATGLPELLGQLVGMPGRCARNVPESELGPGGVTPALQDNFLKVPVQVQQQTVDLEVTGMDAPDRVPFKVGGTYQVRFHVRNLGNRLVRTQYQVTAEVPTQGLKWTTGMGEADFPPGQTVTLAATVPITVPDATHRVTVTVNPKKDPPESSYTNNTRVVNTYVEADQVGSPGGSAGWTPTNPKSVIIPEDCVPNPDPVDAARMPCLNYPDRILEP